MKESDKNNDTDTAQFIGIGPISFSIFNPITDGLITIYQDNSMEEYKASAAEDQKNSRPDN